VTRDEVVDSALIGASALLIALLWRGADDLAAVGLLVAAALLVRIGWVLGDAFNSR
jgi:hypothetical protein